MANLRKLFCWNGVLLLIFTLVDVQQYWGKNKTPASHLCVLPACRLRISACRAHMWTCQSLDLPTEFIHSDCTHSCKRPPKRQLVACYNFQSSCHKHTGFNPQSPERRQVFPTGSANRKGLCCLSRCHCIKARSEPCPEEILWMQFFTFAFFSAPLFPPFNLRYSPLFLWSISWLFFLSFSHSLVLFVQQCWGVKKPPLNSYIATVLGANLWHSEYLISLVRLIKELFYSQLFCKFKIWIL